MIAAVLGILGVVFAIFALVSGLFSGEFERMKDDPNYRKWVEEEKKERERQKAWKDKLK